MKVELHINGKLNIILIPEDSYDHDLLEGMIEAYEKGKAVSLTREDKDESFRGIVGVEK